MKHTLLALLVVAAACGETKKAKPVSHEQPKEESRLDDEEFQTTWIGTSRCRIEGAYCALYFDPRLWHYAQCQFQANIDSGFVYREHDDSLTNLVFYYPRSGLRDTLVIPSKDSADRLLVNTFRHRYYKIK